MYERRLARRRFLHASARNALFAGRAGMLLAACGSSTPWFLRGNFAPVREEVQRDRPRAIDDGPVATVATVALPQRVPYGFHATWVPNEA
jgi:hypothetical protein